MSKKKKYKLSKKTVQDDTRFNEPGLKYVSTQGKNLFQIFKSISVSTLEDQENEMRKYSLSLSPVQRMAYLYQLNQIAFAEILNDPKANLWDKKIIVDSNHDHIP